MGSSGAVPTCGGDRHCKGQGLGREREQSRNPPAAVCSLFSTERFPAATPSPVGLGEAGRRVRQKG